MGRRIHMRLASRFVAGILAFAAFSLAQDIRTGTLVGLVSDSSGSAVPQARVTVINNETKVELKGQTNADGNYDVPYLNVGEYQVTVEAAGFKKFVRLGIIVQAGSTVRIDVPLEVGAVTQEIEVVAASPLLATDSAVVGMT